MHVCTTTGSGNVYPLFSAPEPPTQVQSHHQGPENAQRAPKLDAEQATCDKGPTRMCDLPVAITNSGKNWHYYHRVRICWRCSESARLYVLYRRLGHGKRIALSIADLAAFGKAWETLPESKDRPLEAARAMLMGMAQS